MVGCYFLKSGKCYHASRPLTIASVSRAIISSSSVGTTTTFTFEAAVEITTFSERDNGIIDIDATIYCEKASHKGIIIGKQGAMLKKISSMARTDCEKFMGTKVYLTTWVKVKENWRDSDFMVRNFGYSE